MNGRNLQPADRAPGGDPDGGGGDVSGRHGTGLGPKPDGFGGVPQRADRSTGLHSPVALCTAGRSTGDVVGPFTLTGTSIIPTAQTAVTGVVAYTADVVQHTRNGDLFCKETGVTKVAGDGAASSICVVTGGTGIYSGTSGYIQFQSTLIPPGGFAGTYQGKLTGVGRVPDEGEEDEGQD